ncbi:MAG: MBOAT family protein [Lachnospiraceae bacterium]|nr:MBOAT family protein [Lachnospiraceae bacterium]
MVFSSLEFIFRFLPVFFIIYYLTPAKFRNFVLFAGSIVFYAFGELKYTALILLSVIVNYFIARLMDIKDLSRGKRKLLLAADVFYNVGILVVFKYSAFIMTTINDLSGLELPVPELVLPLGISFYTFQIMSYVIDVYKKEADAEKNLIDMGTYLMMFPQLIAGPIVVYSDASLALKARKVDFSGFEEGLKIFILGLGSKVLLANPFGSIWDSAGMGGYDVMSTPMAWIGAAAYTFQIYFDFNGYSLMAIGLGKMLGFTFPKNFDSPYTARSVTDFWKRWHISLTSWFRQYLYIPMGGNRKGRFRTYINLLIVWFVTGLWHGASWNFVIWGLYYFVLIALERLFLGRLLKNSYVLSRIYTMLAVICGWVIFAVEDISHVKMYLSRMFTLHYSEDYLENIITVSILFVAGILFSTPVFSPWFRRNRSKASGIIVLLMIFWASVTMLVDSAYNPFLYFRF